MLLLLEPKLSLVLGHVLRLRLLGLLLQHCGLLLLSERSALARRGRL